MPRGKKPISPEASDAARQLQALRKHRRGGGSVARVPHVKGLPIGSRKSIRGQGYACMCLRCRIARGHYKPKK